MRILSHAKTAARLRELLSRRLDGTTRASIMYLLADNEEGPVAASGQAEGSAKVSTSASDGVQRGGPDLEPVGGVNRQQALACFQDELSALELLERIVWPNGRVCPRCGARDRVGRLEGNTTRLGTFKCYACRRTFSITTGTVFSSSHVPLHKWMQAIYLLEGGNRTIQPGKLARLIDVSFKTAHRMQSKLCEHAASSSSEPDAAACTQQVKL